MLFPKSMPSLLLFGRHWCDRLRAPPVDFGPGVTPALFSVELSVAVEPVFGFAPVVGPLPASFVDSAPLVGPLPASDFGCANAGAVKPRAITSVSKPLFDENIGTSF
jgi:hypothetical protein